MQQAAAPSTLTASPAAQTMPSEEERFKANTSDLAAVVYNHIERLHRAGHNVVAPTLVKITGALVSAFDAITLIEGFITRSWKIWPRMKGRAKDFFLGDEAVTILFSELPMTNVNAFSALFHERPSTTHPSGRESLIGKAAEDQFWDYFDSLVRISIKYLHKKCVPYMDDDGTKNYINKYRNLAFLEVILRRNDTNDGKEKVPTLNIQDVAAVWGITLIFPPRV
jgi:hypothetical protein